MGTVLAGARRVAYLQEPFNPLTPLNPRARGQWPLPPDEWFLYVCAENGPAYAEPLGAILSLEYDVSSKVRRAEGLRGKAAAVRQWAYYRPHAVMRSRPLVKDPIAVFSAEWLADTFDMDVVMLVRHPAAFVASILRLEMPVRCSNLLRQPLLIRDLLGPFREELEAFERTRPDALAEATMLWRLINHAVDGFRAGRPDWIFARHEDLVRDRVGAFDELFVRLGLRMPNRANRALRRQPYAPPPWKRLLAEDQIARIRASVEAESSRWYGPDEW